MVNVWVDIIIILVYIACNVYWIIGSKKMTMIIDQKNYTISDYTLYVENLPRLNINTYEVKTFFKQFGEIIDCHFARDYNGRLYEF